MCTFCLESILTQYNYGHPKYKLRYVITIDHFPKYVSMFETLLYTWNTTNKLLTKPCYKQHKCFFTRIITINIISSNKNIKKPPQLKKAYWLRIAHIPRTTKNTFRRLLAFFFHVSEASERIAYYKMFYTSFAYNIQC